MARLARDQHGLLHRRQLIAAGWTPGRIASGTRRGVILRVTHNVYALGHLPRGLGTARMAAVLTADGVVSHEDAAAMWGLLPSPPVRHVTTTGPTKSRLGLVVHQSQVGKLDRTTLDAIPVTTVPRTCIDLCDVLDATTFAEAVERVPKLDVSTFRRALQRHPGRRATGPLTRLLDVYGDRTRSKLERAFLKLCRDHGLPKPQVNQPIAGAERDMSWPDARLVIELDSQRHHADRAARGRDARKDIDLTLAGWLGHRMTFEHVVLDPAGAAATVHALRDELLRRARG